MQDPNYLYETLRDETMSAIGKSYKASPMHEKYKIYENAVILPAKQINGRGAYGGCQTANGDFIEESAVPGWSGWNYKITPPYKMRANVLYMWGI